VLNYV